MRGRDEIATAPTGPTAPPARRRSPVASDANPAATEMRDGWGVVLRYQDEERHGGPWLVDLSHRRRWDYQDGRVATQRPMHLPVPAEFGRVGVHGPLVISRMNRTQVAIWHLGAGAPPTMPSETAFTETTDGHCMLAFIGLGVPAVLEHLTSLDRFDPGRAMPFLTQGPVLHVPCQVVTFAADLVVMTLARGYGETFAHAVLHSGALAGLRPGGEEGFQRAFARATAGSSPGINRVGKV